MNYFILEKQGKFLSKNILGIHGSISYSSRRDYDQGFYLNLSQIDSSIKNVHANIQFISYMSILANNKNEFMCKDANVSVYTSKLSKINGQEHFVEEDNSKYKELIMDYISQYPMVHNLVHNAYYKISPGEVVAEPLPVTKNSMYNINNVTCFIECANYLPKGEEHKAAEMFKEILDKFDFKYQINNIKVQNSFINKLLKYKIGRCIRVNFKVILKELDANYIIKCQNGKEYIPNMDGDIITISDKKFKPIIRKMLYNLQKKIKQPIKIYITHDYLSQNFAYSQVSDTGYIKNEIM